MVTKEEICEEFESLGVTVSNIILDRCLELCSTYQKDAETLVEDWMAFGLTAFQTGTPTLEMLTQMERKEYGKMKELKSEKVIRTPEAASKNLKVYTANRNDEEEASLMDTYAHCTTPKSVRSQPRASPAGGKLVGGIGFSPKTYSPSAANTNVSYAERSDSGATVLKFGESNENIILPSAKRVVDVRLYGESDSWLRSGARYMYETVGTRTHSMDDWTEWLGGQLLERNGLTAITGGITTHSAGNLVAYGRIMSETETRLDSSSVMLETSLALNRGEIIPLNLTKLEKYSVFPGQIVAVDANSVNKTLVANRIFCDASLGAPNDLPAIKIDEPLQIIVASGPYTIPDNLTYQPLNDLVKYLVEKQPHVAILTGPFVDIANGSISDGTLAESFDSHFENLLSGIMDPLKDTKTQVILVPSVKDAHHHCVYPTPPFVTKKRYPNLHLVSDPATLSLDGLILGITSVDVLFHLGREELVWPRTSSDKIGRAAQHLIYQQNYYPLFPPDESVPLDYTLFEKHGIFQSTPHILVLPSAFRYFVKKLNNCIVINPEKLVKGNIGGTFAKIEARSPTTSGNVADNISVEIIRI